MIQEVYGKINNKELEHFSEIAYIVKPSEHRSFLIELRTKEQCKKYPNINLLTSDRKIDVSVFITKDCPNSIVDIRFDKNTLVNKILPIKFLEDFVEWTKENDEDGILNWRGVQRTYEREMPLSKNEIFFPRIADIE